MPTTDEIIHDLHEEIAEKTDRLTRPNLALATTNELIDELRVRVVAHALGDYRPIDYSVIEETPLEDFEFEELAAHDE